MHIQDYSAALMALSIPIALGALSAKAKEFDRWKDLLQIAGVMFVVGLSLGAVSPSKPRDLIAEARKEAENREAFQRDADAAIEAVREKARSRQMIDAMTACDYAIKGQLQYPGSYSTSWISESNRQFETAQGWEIYKAFEAKNGFGGSLPHVGHCSITRSGNISVEISRS
ncbi:hypothetical protein ACFZ8E_05045 [Methylobacterium sp. HMF5984]|uniref:hypothetical protein n=1 Tax=Methylobacterium sp. HMF5984 TaxID=3367370 RepID=UPI00385467E3